ncbi:DUF4180 domain-containing protein [Larkinella bovis]|uniref:DUF4180 domain-containing protein n=1 Tax=Larkinella bovis TaxID=683041 RepID=A0ABW0I8T2_9BACT
MEIHLMNVNGVDLAELRSDQFVIQQVQDALDLLANCAYQGAEKIIVQEKHLTPGFFDLKTGLAGDILQKFSTYRIQLAVVGDFSKFTSQSLRDFMYESNQVGRINFVASVDEAIAKLTHGRLNSGVS